MSSSPPFLRLALKPEFDNDGNAIKLGCRMTIENPAIADNSALCRLLNKLGNGTTQCYGKDEIRVSDQNGVLQLQIKDGGPGGRTREYITDRASSGDVTLEFIANPVAVNQKTPIGGRSELRKDQGGLQFMGLSVLPIPFDGDLNTAARYKMIIDWDLTQAPEGTRAVGLFGEGHTERIGPPFELWRMIFQVGPVKSYPPDSVHGSFGFYWFGDAPDTITKLAPLCESLFLRMSEFFLDQASSANPYRIFVRRVTPARGFGGSGGIRSFVLEYDAAIDTINEHEIFYLLAHETVHNWPLLQDTPEDTDDLDLTAWYNEGVADYYGSMLPYRLGVKSKESFLKCMNSKLCNYYTNPLRNISNREAKKNAWVTTHHQTLPYTRGMFYLCKVDAQIRRATEGKKSVDDVILVLLKKLRSEERFGIPEWLQLVEEILGPQASEDYNSMKAGEVILLPTDYFGPKFQLVRVGQHKMDFGFEFSSFNKRVISGLQEGSRAAKAGLKDGDRILQNTFTWQCLQDYNKMMKIRVVRDEEEMNIEYWPRSEELTDSWQLKEIVS